jgi:RecB family exonuclease
MVEVLAAYVADREVLAVEVPFDLDVGERAHLKGVIDRIEVGSEPGTVDVVDLKTGKHPPAKAEMPEHPQLGAYQLAVDEGGLAAVDAVGPGVRSAGGRLVFVGSGKTPGLREQPALDAQPDDGTWAAHLVDEVAHVMAGSAFLAQENKLCSSCPVRRACPIQPEGRQVIA